MGRKFCESAFLALQLLLVATALWFFARLPGVLGLFGLVVGAVLLSSVIGMALRRSWERICEAPERLKEGSGAFLKTQMPFGG